MNGTRSGTSRIPQPLRPILVASQTCSFPELMPKNVFLHATQSSATACRDFVVKYSIRKKCNDCDMWQWWSRGQVRRPCWDTGKGQRACLPLAGMRGIARCFEGGVGEKGRSRACVDACSILVLINRVYRSSMKA